MIVQPNRRPSGGNRAARVAGAGLIAALACMPLVLPSAFAQNDSTPAPATPSADAPFWAKPRQEGPTCPPCEPPAAAAPVSRGPAVIVGALSGAGVVLLFLLWRALANRSRQRAAEPAPPRAAPRPAAVPPRTDGDGGLDPRARARAARAVTPEPAATPAGDFEFADPRTVEIELAENEPGAESATAKEFYGEIAASLLAALRKEPERQDLRRKLLEIYFAGQQTNEFVNLAHEYLAQGGGFRDQFWPEIGAMGARLAPDHELFQDYGAETARARTPARRSVMPLRRFHERDVDQGRLYAAQQGLAADFQRLRADPSFQSSLAQLLADGVRRPAPLKASPELSNVADGAQIYLKQEDRRRFHDDIMINVMGQLLLAQRRGCTRVVTATRDGILGYAVAGAAARVGIESTIYVAERDLHRYYARVLSMRRLGAHLRPIPSGPDGEPPDARRSALEAWMDDPARTQYVSGLTGGPAPYPELVREFLASVGRETAAQVQQARTALPTAVVAGVGDGHLGLGLLTGFLEHASVQLHCVEEKPAAGPTADRSAPEAPGPGARTRREHQWLRDTGRVTYASGDDHETLRVIEQFHATGTPLSTDSARTLAYARGLARRLDPHGAVVVMLTSQEGADFRSQSTDW